jgi:hypothetical protein
MIKCDSVGVTQVFHPMPGASDSCLPARPFAGLCPAQVVRPGAMIHLLPYTADLNSRLNDGSAYLNAPLMPATALLTAQGARE